MAANGSVESEEPPFDLTLDFDRMRANDVFLRNEAINELITELHNIYVDNQLRLETLVRYPIPVVATFYSEIQPTEYNQMFRILLDSWQEYFRQKLFRIEHNTRKLTVDLRQFTHVKENLPVDAEGMIFNRSYQQESDRLLLRMLRQLSLSDEESNVVGNLALQLMFVGYTAAGLWLFSRVHKDFRQEANDFNEEFAISRNLSYLFSREINGRDERIHYIKNGIRTISKNSQQYTVLTWKQLIWSCLFALNSKDYKRVKETLGGIRNPVSFALSQNMESPGNWYFFWRTATCNRQTIVQYTDFINSLGHEALVAMLKKGGVVYLAKTLLAMLYPYTGDNVIPEEITVFMDFVITKIVSLFKNLNKDIVPHRLFVQWSQTDTELPVDRIILDDSWQSLTTNSPRNPVVQLRDKIAETYYHPNLVRVLPIEETVTIPPKHNDREKLTNGITPITSDTRTSADIMKDHVNNMFELWKQLCILSSTKHGISDEIAVELNFLLPKLDKLTGFAKNQRPIIVNFLMLVAQQNPVFRDGIKETIDSPAWKKLIDEYADPSSVTVWPEYPQKKDGKEKAFETIIREYPAIPAHIIERLTSFFHNNGVKDGIDDLKAILNRTDNLSGRLTNWKIGAKLFNQLPLTPERWNYVLLAASRIHVDLYDSIMEACKDKISTDSENRQIYTNIFIRGIIFASSAKNQKKWSKKFNIKIFPRPGSLVQFFSKLKVPYLVRFLENIDQRSNIPNWVEFMGAILQRAKDNEDIRNAVEPWLGRIITSIKQTIELDDATYIVLKAVTYSIHNMFPNKKILSDPELVKKIGGDEMDREQLIANLKSANESFANDIKKKAAGAAPQCIALGRPRGTLLRWLPL